MEEDHIGKEGLVDNVGEGFGHLDSIFSFVSYTIAMVSGYVTSCCLYSAHKLCQITWHSGLLAQLEQHIIVGICSLSHFARGDEMLSMLDIGRGKL